MTHEEQLDFTTQTQPATLHMLQSAVHFARPGRSTVDGQRLPLTAAAAARPRKRIVWLLEGGYTSDTKHLEKIWEKIEQHQTLLEALSLRGFEARLGLLTFGVRGTMHSATRDALHDTGIKPVEMKNLLKDIHLHSVEYLHNIVIQRRQLDTQALRHQTPRPP